MQNNKFSQTIALAQSFQGNLRRDWKQYELGKVGPKGRLGCAVMVFSPETMFEHYGEQNICDQIEEAMTNKQLDIFCIMCNVKPKEDEDTMRRMILIYTRHANDFANMYEDLKTASKESPILKVIDKSFIEKENGKSTYCWFECGNTSVSRKKFEIVFRKLYK
jgi:hypothetical protein